MHGSVIILVCYYGIVNNVLKDILITETWFPINKLKLNDK